MAKKGESLSGRQLWASQIELASKEGRRELVLSSGLEEEQTDSPPPEALFGLSMLNFLEISRSGICAVSCGIGNLEALTKLVLHSNRLSEVPTEIGQLTKLKLLDLSNNKITSLPSSLSSLSQLETLNVEKNELKEVPSLSAAAGALNTVNFGNNQISEFPTFLLENPDDFIHLGTLKGKGNCISEVPAAVGRLPALKTLDLAENQLKSVPAELADAKLKDLSLDGNPFSDRRLAKLLADKHSKTSTILEYIRSRCPKSMPDESKAEKGEKTKKPKKKMEARMEEPKHRLVVEPASEEHKIVISAEVVRVRPHVVCCLIRGLDLQGPNFKSFLDIQNKLHDSDKACNRRLDATIATHNFAAVRFPLRFTAVPPEELQLTPLRSSKEISAKDLVSKLTEEAELVRKKEKRNTYSGVHKYLTLVKDLEMYPCLMDAEDVVISFPPITNCDRTKMGAEFCDLLVEVTSAKDQAVCKRVMTQLIQESLFKLATPSSDSDAVSLTIQQVKIQKEDGSVHVTFPDKHDLAKLIDVQVVRAWE